MYVDERESKVKKNSRASVISIWNLNHYVDDIYKLLWELQQCCFQVSLFGLLLFNIILQCDNKVTSPESIRFSISRMSYHIGDH